MKLKMHFLILSVMMMPRASFAMEILDFCTNVHNRGSCYFGSYSFYQDATVYFTCSTIKSKKLKISSEGVLISGFTGARETGKGTFNLDDKQLREILSMHYFEVHRDILHPQVISKIEFEADQDIICEIASSRQGDVYSKIFD